MGVSKYLYKKETQMKQSEVEIRSNRRTFLKKGALAAGAAMVGAGLFGAGKVAFGQEHGGGLTKGEEADAATREF
jgi:hypothetical protein